MIQFLKKNIYQILSICVLIFLIVGFSSWIKSGYGKITFQHFLGTFPFAKFLLGQIQRITGLRNGIPDITVNSVFLDFTKLLVSSVFKGFLFFIGSKLFLHIPTYRNQILGSLSQIIDSTQAVLKSPWYKIKESFVSLVSVLIATFFVNLIINPLTSFVNSLDKLHGNVFNIIFFVIVYFICSLLFSFISGYSLGFSVIITAVFQLLPEVLNIFITNGLVLATYLHVQAYEWKDIRTILCFLILLGWCALSTTFVNWLKRFILPSYVSQANVGQLPQTVFSILLTIDYVLLFYVMCLNTVNEQNFLTQNIGKIPLVSQIVYNISISEYVFSDIGVLWGLFFICLTMMALNMTKQIYSTNIIANFFIWDLSLGISIVLELVVFAGVCWVRDIGDVWKLILNIIGIVIILFLMRSNFLLILGTLVSTVLTTIGLSLLQHFEFFNMVLLNNNIELFLVICGILVISGFIIYMIKNYLF